MAQPRVNPTSIPAATLSHYSILNNGFFVGEALRYSEQDRVCIPVPFYHVFGMVLGNLACTTHESTMARQLEVEYKDGYEELSAIAGDFGFGIGRLRSTSQAAATLRHELCQCTRRKGQIVVDGD